MKLYLASRSERRIDMLKNAGVDFTPFPVDVDESHAPDEEPEKYVRRTALAKAEKAFSELSGKEAGLVVLGADTIVLTKGAHILGKPKDAQQAEAMLRALSGEIHHVLTGYAVKTAEEHETASVRTEVRFRRLSDDEIKGYVLTGEPMGKAGAYAIQGAFGAVLADTVNGSYSNIVGLPLKEALDLISRLSAGIE
jgi:septum formation protein